ncbi:hypothetical protein T03_6559, partial [Trichinella britovi]
LGTWDPKNDAILKRIGVVSQRYLRLMKVLVVSEMLEHSSRIYRRHLGLRDLLPDTGAKRRPVGTTETDPPGGDLRQKKRNSISARASVPTVPWPSRSRLRWKSADPAPTPARKIPAA